MVGLLLCVDEAALEVALLAVLATLTAAVVEPAPLVLVFSEVAVGLFVECTTLVVIPTYCCSMLSALQWSQSIGKKQLTDTSLLKGVRI